MKIVFDTNNYYTFIKLYKNVEGFKTKHNFNDIINQICY
jgi:hypothetical protein